MQEKFIKEMGKELAKGVKTQKDVSNIVGKLTYLKHLFPSEITGVFEVYFLFVAKKWQFLKALKFYLKQA